MKPNDGGPAFPSDGYVRAADGEVYEMERCGGLSKRDWFAGKAMEGLLSDAKANLAGPPADSAKTPAQHVAKTAVQIADAMIAELEKDKETPTADLFVYCASCGLVFLAKDEVADDQCPGCDQVGNLSERFERPQTPPGVCLDDFPEQLDD